MDAVRLLYGMSDSISTSLQTSSNDIGQTISLLNQAVDQLTQQFLSIHQDIGLLGQQFHSGLAPTDASSVLLAHCQEKIRHVVTTLQFHDIANQLLTRTEGRLADLQPLLAQLSPHSDPVTYPRTDADVAAYVKGLNRLLTDYNSDIQTSYSSAIKQTQLSCGEIELF